MPVSTESGRKYRGRSRDTWRQYCNCPSGTPESPGRPTISCSTEEDVSRGFFYSSISAARCVSDASLSLATRFFALSTYVCRIFFDSIDAEGKKVLWRQRRQRELFLFVRFIDECLKGRGGDKNPVRTSLVTVLARIYHTFA